MSTKKSLWEDFGFESLEEFCNQRMLNYDDVAEASPGRSYDPYRDRAAEDRVGTRGSIHHDHRGPRRKAQRIRGRVPRQ